MSGHIGFRRAPIFPQEKFLFAAEEALMRSWLRWIIILTVPLVLVMGLVRILTLPWYPAWVYSHPGFPEDPLGMSSAERLVLARDSIAFLNLPRGSGNLGDLWLPDGSPAFNARELSHMDDVKLVYDRLTTLIMGALALSILLGWFLSREGNAAWLWGAISDGGLLTVMILGILGLWMVLGFNAFFTTFHGLFFSEGSWTFRYSDTLIRLFPLKFWQDSGILIAVIVGIIALILALLGRALQKRYLRQNHVN